MDISLNQPQNIEAEQQVLGACLVDRLSAESVQEIISPSDFYIPGNGDIFEAIIHVLSNGKTPDVLTVTEALRNRKQLEKVGGVVYVASLFNQVASTVFAVQHAEIIRTKAISRKVIEIAEKIKAKAYTGEFESPTELLSFAEIEITSIDVKGDNGGLEHVGRGIKPVLQEIEERGRRKTVTGIPTGYMTLTAWLAGYQPGDLIIVAARPSMGKTSFAIQEAKDMAINHGKKVAFFSLEMSRKNLIEKLLVNEGLISAQNVRVGRMQPEEWDKIGNAAERLLKAGVYIDDTSRVSAIDIAHRCKKMKIKHGLDAIFIDYMGLMKPVRKAERRDLEVGETSRELKFLAKELEVPVIALNQLSRDCEKRDNKRPINSDLRDSGSLEQDADVIMFIYRDEVYNKDTTKKGIAEIILSKQRNGPTGIMDVAWMRECTKFMPMEQCTNNIGDIK